MDIIEGAVMAWCYALWPHRSWDEELDTPRMRHAFQQLLSQCTHWPAPRHFLDNLPARASGRPRLTAVATDATRNRHMTQISDLLGGLSKLDPQKGAQS